MTDRLVLRPMTLDDVDDVVALDRRAFGESGWSRRHFAGEITESPISILYVLVNAEQRIIAYFGTWHIVDQLHLCTFAVDIDQHGQGLGAILLAGVLRLAQRLRCEVIQLEVRESNEPARRLYRSRGFHEEAVRRNLYSTPKEDGILMTMATPGEAVSDSNEAVSGRISESGRRWPGEIELRWDDRGGIAEEHWPGR